MGFPRQECWRELPFPSPGDLPDPGIEPPSPALAGGFFTTEPPGKEEPWKRNRNDQNICGPNDQNILIGIGVGTDRHFTDFYF